MTIHPPAAPPTPVTAPLSTRVRTAVSVAAVLLLPLSVYAALGATVATVMAVASGGEYNVTGFALVAAGLLLMVTPIVVVVALVVMWVATGRGRHRLARGAAWVPLPLLAVTLALFAAVLAL